MSLASPAAPIRSRRSARLLAAAATATAVALFAMGAGDAAQAGPPTSSSRSWRPPS